MPLTKDEKFIQEFAIRFQRMRKEKNYVTFILNNDLSDAEIEHLRMKAADTGGRPHRVKFPNGEVKIIDWTGMI